MVQVWNTQNWACERVIEAHTDSVWALVVADCPDGAKLVSASVDQTLHVWDTDTWTSQQVLTGHSGPVRSPLPNAASFSSFLFPFFLFLCFCRFFFHSRRRLPVADIVVCGAQVYALTTMEGKIVSGSHDETVVVWAFDAADGW